MQSDQGKNLQKLKSLLLNEEKLQLATLEDEVGLLKQTIEDKEALIESLDPVVADLLSRKINSSKDEMAAALAPVMGDAIKQQIGEAKEDVVDALYPIIGQTIRKSVAEAMKRLVDSVNEKLDRAIRQRFFSRKIKSKIAGVTEGELLLRENLPFRIEEIFLIHKESGLLLSHVSAPNASANVNQELISGMLTAIRNFSSDIFKADAPEEVHEIQYEDHKIKVTIGRYYYLALVITGVEPENLTNEILHLDRQIHNKFYKPLREFDGDISTLAGIEQPISKFINTSNNSQKTGPKPRAMLAWLGLFVLVLAVLILAIIMVPDYLSRRDLQKRVQLQLEAYPELTNQPLSFEFENGNLIVSGYVATPEAKNGIDSVLQLVNGVRAVENDVRVRRPSPELEAAIRQKLATLSQQTGILPQIIIEGDLVHLTGEAPSFEIKHEIGYRISKIPGVRVVNNDISVNHDKSITYIRNFIESQIIYFAVNESKLSPENREILDQVVQRLQQHPELRLVIKGFSDDQADSTYNLDISRQRAQAVAAYFMTNQISAEQLKIEFFGEKFPRNTNDTPEGRAQNRRVEFEIQKER